MGQKAYITAFSCDWGRPSIAHHHIRPHPAHLAYVTSGSAQSRNNPVGAPTMCIRPADQCPKIPRG